MAIGFLLQASNVCGPKVAEVVDLLSDLTSTPVEMVELYSAVGKYLAVEPEHTKSDLVSHLREVCSEDRTKDHALAEMLKDISLSHRELKD